MGTQLEWQIIDDDEVIHSGTSEEIQLIWDLATRSIIDLSNEYRNTYSKKQLKELYNIHWLNCPWKGDLKLIEVHKIHR